MLTEFNAALNGHKNTLKLIERGALGISENIGNELTERGYVFNFQSCRAKPVIQINCHGKEKTRADFDEDVQVIIEHLGTEPTDVRASTIGYSPFCFEANWDLIEMRAYRMLGCNVEFIEETRRVCKINCPHD